MMRFHSSKSPTKISKRHRDDQWNPRANAPLNFKKFILLTEGISPEDAPKKYQAYLISFLTSEIKRFYDAYENLPFFREKYHPYYLKLEYEMFKQSYLNNNKLLFETISAGQLAGIQLKLSYDLLYGRHTDSSENESYAMPQWAYEIILDKTPEPQTINRLLLNSPLESVLLVDIPDYSFKTQIVDILKTEIEIFEIYIAERIGGRTVFICVPHSVNLELMSKKLNEQNHFIGDYCLKFEPCKPIKDKIRVRVCPPLCSHPIRIQRDLYLTSKLIQKLDNEISSNMQIDNNQSFLNLLPQDLNDQQRLDLQLFYLRRVHYYCYYGRMKCPTYMDLWDKFGPGHMRVDLKNDIKQTELNEGLSNTNIKVNFASWQNPVADKQIITDSSMDGVKYDNVVSIDYYDDWQMMIETDASKNGYSVSKSQIQWVKDVEDYAKMVLETDIRPPEMDSNNDEIEKRWEQFCHVHTLADAPERFRCKLCQKLFSDSKYVWKHLKLKHFDKHTDIVIQSGMSDMKDLFFWSHCETKTNPFESLVQIPPILDSTSRSKPVKDYAKDASRMALENWDLSQMKSGPLFKGDSSFYNRKRNKEYHDFDKPDPKQSIAVFTPEVYSRPTVKYDDL